MISTSDQPPGFDSSTLESLNATSSPRPRHESNALLMLPTPLSVSRSMMASTSTVGASRSSEDNYLSDTGSNSNHRLTQSPEYTESYESVSSQRHLSPPSPYDSSALAPRVYNGPTTRSVPSPQPYPGVSPSESANPFRSLTTSPVNYDESVSGCDSEEIRHSRGGVRLMDSGPVPAPEGVRRIRAGGRRPTSQQTPQQNRYSHNSTNFALPPGAAPPQPYGSGGGMQ